jgi:hypothetical protein
MIRAVHYLINKHDKIFFKEVLDEASISGADLGKTKLRLNSTYIQEKLQATQQAANSLKKGKTNYFYLKKCLRIIITLELNEKRILFYVGC